MVPTWHAVGSALAATVALVSAPAQAAAPAVGVVLDIPEASVRERNVARASVEDGIGRHGWTASESSAKPPLVIRVRIRTSPGIHRIAVKLETAQGTVLEETSTVCEICGLSEIKESIADRSANLVAQYEADQDAAPILRVRARPAHAEILVDGRRQGVSSAEVELEPGAHVIEVSAEGFVRQRRTLTLTRGTQRDLSIRLSPSPPSNKGSSAPAKPFFIAGAATLASGAAALAGGGALVAIHGDPILRNCNADPNGNCARLHDTRTAGVVSMAAGALAIGAGVALVWVGRKRQRGRPRVTPLATGLQLRF